MSTVYPWQGAIWQRLVHLYQQQRLPHAILLDGRAGMGKGVFARKIARAMLCVSPDEQGMACGQCPSCQLWQAGSHPDYYELSPEEGKLQIRVDAVREVVGFLGQTSARGGLQVVIIEPADAMNSNAANALLKTLEEPTPNTLILLLTASPGRLLPTIRSRCFRHTFRPDFSSDTINWLAGELQVEDREAQQALVQSVGAPLLAVSQAQQGAVEQRTQFTRGLQDLAQGKRDAVQIAAEWLQLNGHEGINFIEHVLHEWLRRSVLSKYRPSESELASLLEGVRQWHDVRALYKMQDRLSEMRRRSDASLNLQLFLEEILLMWSFLAKAR